MVFMLCFLVVGLVPHGFQLSGTKLTVSFNETLLRGDKVSVLDMLFIHSCPHAQKVQPFDDGNLNIIP